MDDNVKTLIRQLSSVESGKRLEACRDLACLREAAEAAIPALINALQDPSTRVVIMARVALNSVGLAGLLSLLQESATSVAPDRRLPALLALPADPEAPLLEARVMCLLDALTDTEPGIRSAARSKMETVSDFLENSEQLNAEQYRQAQSVFLALAESDRGRTLSNFSARIRRAFERLNTRL